jgi:endonuclease-3
MKRAERFEAFVEYFSKNQPTAETELHYTNPYELLVAVVLSAQCTDKRVNMVTPALFNKYPNPQTLAKATSDEIFSYIRSISYPNNKAKHLVGLGQMLIKDFGGEVPESIEDLVKLPGVGRKTANVIASVIYDKPAMAVDTHVFRVSARLGLTYRAKTPLQAEQQLVKYIPEQYIATAHHWLILHGRYVCTARNPKCNECQIRFMCKTMG